MLKSVRPMTIPLLLIAAAAHAIPVDDWRQDSLILVTADRTDTPVNVENRGTTQLLLAPASGTINRMRYIVGASQSGPPAWHAKFSPLQNNWVSVSWSHPYVAVDPGHGFRVEVRWTRSAGEQVFRLFHDGQPTSLTINRQRDWHDPHVHPGPVFLIWYPLSAPPGGSPPPGGG
jgi:hypothetical protein